MSNDDLTINNSQGLSEEKDKHFESIRAGVSFNEPQLSNNGVGIGLDKDESGSMATGDPTSNAAVKSAPEADLVLDQALVSVSTGIDPATIQNHSTYLSPNLNPTNFPRCVQWCADGRAILITYEDSKMSVAAVGEDLGIKPSITVENPAPILSTAWFPTASPTDPASYCFVSAVRDRPVRLLDASDGRLRASYRIIDHQERFIAPHSMAFNMYMNKLYCGFEDAIEIFDVHNPGAEGTRMRTIPTKKSRDGLRGIVSALAFAPDWSGLYAAGSYSAGIAMYTEDTGAQIQSWLEGVSDAVTQIKFNSTKPHLVHAAFRRTSIIATWDLRKPDEPVGLYDRGVVKTNQRLWFDVSPDGRTVATGDEVGMMRLFDVERMGEDAYEGISVDAHRDAIGTVAFHPAKPFILTTSGSRHFDESESDQSSSDDSGDIEDVEIMVSGVWHSTRESLARVRLCQPTTRDNCIKLWSYENNKRNHQ